MASSPLGVQVGGFGSAWTTGIARVIGTPATATGPVTLAQATGTDQRTPDGQGTIVLVTPTLVTTNLAGLEQIPLITTLELEIGETGMMPHARILRMFYEGGYRGEVCCEVSSQVWRADQYDPKHATQTCFTNLSKIVSEAGL